jgi:hypothetical protein
MQEEEQQQRQRLKKRVETYMAIVTTTFVFTVCFLVAGNRTAVEISLMWMLALRSYGLLFLGMNREWIGIFFYAAILLYYTSQNGSGLF